MELRKVDLPLYQLVVQLVHPALGPDGKLLDASKIIWYHDPDDLYPIHPISTEGDALNSLVFWIGVINKVLFPY